MRRLCKVPSFVKFLRFLPTTALQRLVKLVVGLCHVLPSRAGLGWSRGLRGDGREDSMRRLRLQAAHAETSSRKKF